MELNISLWLGLLLTVVCSVYCDRHGDRHGDDNSSESSEEGDHHGHKRKKAIVMSVLGVVVLAIVTAIIVICICKKKKAHLKRTEPSGIVIQADPLPAKKDLSTDYNTNPSAVYNITPNYQDLNKGGQPIPERPFDSPPPAYSYDQ